MKTSRHTAIGKCSCGNFICSSGGGRFISCPKCNEFIDQERWGGSYVRTGGMKLIEQICPSTCDNGEAHKNNKKIDDLDELQKYLKDNYKQSL